MRAAVRWQTWLGWRRLVKDVRKTMIHPHLNPRQPRSEFACGTNPPVFVWEVADAAPGASRNRLTLARDADLSDVVWTVDTDTPIHLPTAALAPGDYWWTVTSADTADPDDTATTSETWRFTVPETAPVVEVPEVETWLERMSSAHPRLHVREEELAQLRARFADSPLREGLLERATATLAEPHDLAEPDHLPDIEEVGQEAWFKAWRGGVEPTQAFVNRAQDMALAYVLTEEPAYARAAAQRIVSLAQWDPDGATEVSVHSEGHMATYWHTAKVTDWVWDHFTEAERGQVIDHYAKRSANQFQQLAHTIPYGTKSFDSHSGRKIVFLSLWALVLADEVPEALTWLRWLRPVTCGIWPVWSGEDGAWAEGPSYASAYVAIMSMLATTLKHQADVDIYQRPFWEGHAQWRRWMLPAYAEWMGFGDGTTAATSRGSNRDLIETVARETGNGVLRPYLDRLNAQLELEGGEGKEPAPSAEKLLLSLMTEIPEATLQPESHARIFPGTGWAGIRSHLDGEAADDVAVGFRSSPFGSVSHSHADNNDFFMHVGGQIMLMPSGYYDGYSTDHHAHWARHTKAHNCVTLSDAGQLSRSPLSVGAIEAASIGEQLVYWRGNADASYPQADRCRRHLLWLPDVSVLVLLDEMVPLAQTECALQSNLHSFAEFQIEDQERRFTLRLGDSSLTGHFLHHQTGFFETSDVTRPETLLTKRGADQYHLRFSLPYGPAVLPLVLVPGVRGQDPAPVETELQEGREYARVGEWAISVSAHWQPGEEIARISGPAGRWRIDPEAGLVAD
ncbi:hypothetical protein CGZ91_08900 [Parenemella sanctibonifatiensis]|uniref:Uncharacterized protein n=2 Tax=Parenemella sanctibonifatiensis TaxID=2016505 RepID=A0A255EG81_9ACTN|nr:hypothetical protein CGZ91_08900 [Parenemella sanctibonifatiensis]